MEWCYGLNALRIEVIRVLLQSGFGGKKDKGTIMENSQLRLGCNYDNGCNWD